MELNRRAITRIDVDKIARFHRLAPVKSSKVELLPASVGTGSATFTPAEMRHNFAIWALNKDASAGRAAHLYYCIRCKHAFSVDDRSNAVTPLDSQGNPLQGSEAVKRLDTFSCGPCPAFSGLTAGPRLTSKVIPIQAARLTKLTSAGHRTWKTLMAQWRLFLAMWGTQNVRSKRKWMRSNRSWSNGA
jgi:hypothetical protein